MCICSLYSSECNALKWKKTIYLKAKGKKWETEKLNLNASVLSKDICSVMFADLNTHTHTVRHLKQFTLSSLCIGFSFNISVLYCFWFSIIFFISYDCRLQQLLTNINTSCVLNVLFIWWCLSCVPISFVKVCSCEMWYGALSPV